MPAKLSYKYKIFSISGIPKDSEFQSMVFGRRCDFYKNFEIFKKTAKSAHISQKNQSSARAISEFVKLNGVKEYFCAFYDKKESPDYWDDSFEIFYKN